jgi:dTMP kinase
MIESVKGGGARFDRFLSRIGVNLTWRSFPDYSGSFLGPTIGKMLAGSFGDISDVHPVFTSALFALERAEKRKELISLLQNGVTVVCDRYVYSNVAHQACRLAVDEQDSFITWIETVEFVILGMPKPDVTVLLDLEDSDSQNLRESRDAHDYSNTVLDQHERDLNGISNARRIYLKLSQKLYWKTVLCSSQEQLRGIEDISSELINTIKNCDL